MEKELSRLADLAERTSIWKPASIQQEPETVLNQWQVFEVASPEKEGAFDIHFMGRAGHSGRVCSAIQEFDKATMRGRSRSGRIYELQGPPGHSGDAMYVWGQWLRINGDPVTKCVTEQYAPEFVRPPPVEFVAPPSTSA